MEVCIFFATYIMFDLNLALKLPKIGVFAKKLHIKVLLLL